MVDFQTLTLLSLTFLTAAMFIFYYLLVIRYRRTPPVKRIMPQEPVESQTFSLQTKIKDPILNPIQIPTQAPVQTIARVDIPIQTQSQIPSQAPVQATSQVSVQAPIENVFSMPTRTPILRGEAATEALTEFVEELEKGRGPITEKTRDASLIKLARVLIDVIQADKAHEKPSELSDQDKHDVKSEKTAIEPPHKHYDSGKKKANMHGPSGAKAAAPKARKRRTKISVKGKKHRRPPKKHSKHSRATNVHSKHVKKARRARKN